MQASRKDLETLIQIQDLQARVSRYSNQILELRSGAVLREKEAERIDVAGQLTRAMQRLDELQIELKRAETDLQLVEARISRDTNALNTTTSTKDAAGLQHELQTLSKRKSDLEDIQLELLEGVENQREIVESLTGTRQRLAEELSAAQAALVEEISNLQREVDSGQLELAGLIESIPSELWGLYETKSRRGVAIGRLVKLTCSACNMGLTSAAHREISASAADQLVTCSECGAILLRDF